MTLSLRQLARHIYHETPATSGLRQLCKLPHGNLHLKVRAHSFSILTYNTALLPDVGPVVSYNGTDRAGAINELVARILDNPPDVVGLCEIFDDEERNFVRGMLGNIYQHALAGPDKANLDQDGGLLLLSKHPFLALGWHASRYRECGGMDCWANKGILHIRIQPETSPMPYDIFYTHAQDIEPDGGKEALYSQLLHLNHMAHAYGDPHQPTFILGDLNIPGEIASHYKQLIQRLSGPVDLWLAQPKALPSPGFTNTRDNNFYEDPEDVPPKDSRLDYILLKAGLNVIPILKNIELLKWSHNGRQISDHYGLLAHFDQLVAVEVNMSGTISAVRACIKAFRCIAATGEFSLDDVAFTLFLQDSHDNLAASSTDQFEDVQKGQSHDVNMRHARLDGDPGELIIVQVTGTESGDDSLGKKSISLSRIDLLLHQGGSFVRYMPFLTEDDSAYSLLVEIFVD